LSTKVLRGTFLGTVLTAAMASAQTPGTVANNPFPNGIAQGALVGIADVATVPNSNNARARLNSASVSPDGRFFVMDQRGPIYSISAGVSTPYLNLATSGLGLLNDNQERGASTVAFHPQFTQVGTAGYGKLYVALSTNNSGTTPDSQVAGQRTHDEVVYEFTTSTPLSNTFTPSGSPREVMRIARPGTNHNGGQVGFNPNAAPGQADYGLLYISQGDSGGSGDPFGVAQNNNSLMGKILRINPLGMDGPGSKYGIAAGNVFAADGNANTRAEIYAVGFRNPQRFSWDRGGNQKMYAGDVGQGKIEEIDVITNGANYGWGEREGRFDYVNSGTVAFPPNPDNPLYTLPMVEYDHDEGSAVSGGFVYRGNMIPALTGKYVFGDLQNGRIFYTDADTVFGGQAALSELRLTEDGATSKTLLQIINETSGVTATRVDLRLGQDAAGNLYVLNKQDGIVRMLVPEPGTAMTLMAMGAFALRRRTITR
jgi:glucose/arabinose dehydrogenase